MSKIPLSDLDKFGDELRAMSFTDLVNLGEEYKRAIPTLGKFARDRHELIDAEIHFKLRKRNQ